MNAATCCIKNNIGDYKNLVQGCSVSQDRRVIAVAEVYTDNIKKFQALPACTDNMDGVSGTVMVRDEQRLNWMVLSHKRYLLGSCAKLA